MSAPAEAPARAAGSSLVPSSESSGEIAADFADDLCVKRPYWVVADDDPSLRFPSSCDAYRCEKCGPRKARTAAAVITWGARQVTRRRLVTLTALPDDWQIARGQVNDWVSRIRREFPFEMAWAIEQNPRGTGYHAHGVQHGSYVPQNVLQNRWGGRIVDIRAMKRPGAGAYAVKEAMRVAGYVVKGGAVGGGLDDHLDRNGGRVVHMTRGYLGGLTKRQALDQIALEQAGGQHRTWHLELAQLEGS